MAINRHWRNQDGQQQEETTFVDVDAFGRQAETIGQYLKKGRPIMVEGRLKLDQWEDKQTGQKRSKMGVTLENFTSIPAAKAAVMLVAGWRQFQRRRRRSCIGRCGSGGRWRRVCRR